MQQHVRITVTDQVVIVLDRDAAQFQRSAVTQPVSIVSDTDSKRLCNGLPPVAAIDQRDTGLVLTRVFRPNSLSARGL